MDDDSDVDRELDNSLVDLHHGLDSSTEENRPEDNYGSGQDVYVGNGTEPVDIPAPHVSMLEDMVQEMRQGLQAAVEELAKLQVREDGERDKQIQQQQQRQLDSLTENVNDLKGQMNSVTKCLETIQRENIKLREDYAALTKFVKDNNGDGMTHMSDHSFDWNEKLSENPFEERNGEEEVTYRDDPNKDNDEVTAVACKSLSLTQALHLNLSMSSDEGDEPEMRRLSHYAPNTATTATTSHQKEEINRRHSLPASTTPCGNSNDHVINAGQRRKAVKELTDSECDYCSQLWTLIETYCASLQNAGFLSHDQLEILFPSYLEKLYEQHCVIYSNLQDKLVHWSYLSVVSDLLSCITDTHNPYSLLSLYRDYSENLPDAVLCLRNALAHSTELKALLKTIQQSSYQNDDLMTLIKAPAQHLPKYLLQLQQICKYTPSTHPDYLLLRTSLSRLRLFVEQINIGINSAIQTSSQDFRPGSSNDSSQLLSARDSGNISNEDELLSARTLFKSEQCLLSEELPEDSYHLSVHNNQVTPSSYYGRPSRAMPRPKSTNLSTLSHPDLSRINGSPVPGSVPFSLPPTGLNHGWRNGLEGRSSAKNKHQMKRMQVQQSAFPDQDPNHHLSTSRPSSAIDFTNGYNHNSYPVHHYPGSSYPRPRSAMGPLDSHHRPIIISRKHMRRSQPPLSNSGYWADVDSQHLKHSQQKIPFSPLELMPSRPSPLLPYNSQEDDEEDDTRASDSFSCLTSSSHQHSSGRGSNNDHDIDLDFQPLASDPSPFRPNGSKHFSEHDVAVRLAQELLSDDDDDDRNGSDKVEIDDVLNNKKLLQAVENRNFRHQRVSGSKKNVDDQETGKKVSASNQQLSFYKSQKKGQVVTKLSNSNESNGFEILPNEVSENKSSNDNLHISTHQVVLGEQKDQESRAHKQNGDHKKEMLTTKDQYDNYYDEEGKRMKNQNFLLSLTHSPRSKKSSETSLRLQDSHRNSTRSPQSKSPVPPTSEDKNQEIHYPVDKISHKSQPKVSRRSAPSLISNASNVPQPRDQEPTRISSPTQSSNGYYRNDLDNSVTSGATSRKYTRTPSPSSSAALPSEVATERSSNKRRDINDDSKNLMTRSLDLSEALNTEDTKESAYDRRKKLKNGGVDSLPRASDDPVNARKKMHLKSSIKNLFSKKRGKVILADVEREVILEMASAVVSASTNPPSTNAINCSPVVDLPCVDNQKFDSSVVFCNRELANSTRSKEAIEKEQQQQMVQRLPDAFEIRCKKDKGSSTSSPFKVWRPISYIQPSVNLAKSFHRLSLNPENLPQSPCTYQEKLLKERLNIQGNPDLEQKPLIHPKFLMSAKLSKTNEKGCLPMTTASSSATPTVTTNNNLNITCASPEPQIVVSKEKRLQEDKCKKGKDNLCKSISKYEEAEKKQIKAKMKAYAHMKKHILNYESQEADMKDKDDVIKRNQDRNNAKQAKPKVECLKCQHKLPESWKHVDQTPGKSFHIQAYKAYKNKTREITNLEKQETDILQNKDQHFQQQNMIKSEIISSQNSMHFLKPCEEAIAFYETSRDPKMTSSYPMASQEKKLKKKTTSKESGPLLHSNQARVEVKNYKSKEKCFRENILSLSSGVFYEGESSQPQTDSFTIGNNIPTNDLSHPTCTVMSCNSHSVSKSHCSFNVPAASSTINTQQLSSNFQNKRHSYEGASCSNNILRMSKEELIEYEKNRALLKDIKGKSEPKKVITKQTNGKGCLAGDSSKLAKSEDQEVFNDVKQKQPLANEVYKEERGEYFPKEERDYFDYTYRLCYVDCSKLDGDLSSCTNCSVEENGLGHENLESKSVGVRIKPGETINSQNLVDATMKPNCNLQENCSTNLDQALQIETKSCSELNKWLSSINNSLSLQNRDSVSTTMQSKEKVLSPNQPNKPDQCCTTQKSDSSSFAVANQNRAFSISHALTGSQMKDSYFPSSTLGQFNNVNCTLHQPLAMNRYNCRSSTFETFSPSMSQPIFSVLPIEGYRVDTQIPMKNGSLACQKPYESYMTSQADPNSLKSQDDAVARRALKQRMKSKESVRLSTCSIQSSNEIHILKLHTHGDSPCSTEPNSQVKHIKEGSSYHKNNNPGTLQVRYVPKQFASPNQKVQVQTTAHAQIRRDSLCLNGTMANIPNHHNVIKCSSSSTRYSNTICQVNQPISDQNGMSASGISGPDLLQVSVIQPKSESSDPGASISAKKQSFFSRFAHSPLSIFYKDNKNNGSK